MYELEVGQASNIVSKLKENNRNLQYELKVIGAYDKEAKKNDGVYLVFGTDKNAISNATYNDTSLIEEYRHQAFEKASVYPHCTIYKFNRNACYLSELFDKRNNVELIQELFKKYDLPVPFEISQRDFISIYHAYVKTCEEGLNPLQQENYDKNLEFQLKVLASGLTQEEYEKKYGEFTSVITDKKLMHELRKQSEDFMNKKVVYKPKSKNCVSDEELKRSGIEFKSVNIDHDILPYFEADMAQYPDIIYSLVEESKPSPYGDSEYKYWHMLTFPVEYEQTVCATMHKYEHEISDISKQYVDDDNKSIHAVKILAADFDDFYKFAKRHNVQFYFDENGTYIDSTADTIGIVTEDEVNRKLLTATLSAMLNKKMNSTWLIQDKEELNKDVQQIEDMSR